MVNIPTSLIHAITAQELSIVMTWWEELDTTFQMQIIDLCDRKNEESFFQPSFVGEKLPIVFGGRFLPHDDAWCFSDWEDDWREYLSEKSGQYHGNGLWSTASFFIMSQIRAKRILGDEIGIGYRLPDWSLTTFAIDERPPSEHFQNE